jgi:hypothetical protein
MGLKGWIRKGFGGSWLITCSSPYAQVVHCVGYLSPVNPIRIEDYGVHRLFIGQPDFAPHLEFPSRDEQHGHAVGW